MAEKSAQEIILEALIAAVAEKDETIVVLNRDIENLKKRLTEAEEAAAGGGVVCGRRIEYRNK